MYVRLVFWYNVLNLIESSSLSFLSDLKYVINVDKLDDSPITRINQTYTHSKGITRSAQGPQIGDNLFHLKTTDTLGLILIHSQVNCWDHLSLLKTCQIWHLVIFISTLSTIRLHTPGKPLRHLKASKLIAISPQGGLLIPKCSIWKWKKKNSSWSQDG